MESLQARQQGDRVAEAALAHIKARQRGQSLDIAVAYRKNFAIARLCLCHSPAVIGRPCGPQQLIGFHRIRSGPFGRPGDGGSRPFDLRQPRRKLPRPRQCRLPLLRVHPLDLFGRPFLDSAWLQQCTNAVQLQAGTNGPGVQLDLSLQIGDTSLELAEPFEAGSQSRQSLRQVRAKIECLLNLSTAVSGASTMRAVP